MGLVMQKFGQLLGISLSFIRLGRHYALKTDIEGETYYISLDEGGRFLSPQEILDLVFDTGQTRRLDFTDLLLAYLESVQKQLDPNSAGAQILKVYDIILALKNADPKTLLRRALLNRELGHFSEALADLKRFLYFQPGDPLPPSIQKLYSHFGH